MRHDLRLDFPERSCTFAVHIAAGKPDIGKLVGIEFGQMPPLAVALAGVCKAPDKTAAPRQGPGRALGGRTGNRDETAHGWPPFDGKRIAIAAHQ